MEVIQFIDDISMYFNCAELDCCINMWCFVRASSYHPAIFYPSTCTYDHPAYKIKP